MNFDKLDKLLIEAFLPPTPENIAAAKQFVMEKWKERANERSFSIPKDLSGACKFASLFAQKVFGGRLQGNWHHQYVVKGNQTIDLTDAAGVNIRNPYHHDPEFWMNPEHRTSLQSCMERVNKWVEEFKQNFSI